MSVPMCALEQNSGINQFLADKNSRDFIISKFYEYGLEKIEIDEMIPQATFEMI